MMLGGSYLAENPHTHGFIDSAFGSSGWQVVEMVPVDSSIDMIEFANFIDPKRFSGASTQLPVEHTSGSRQRIEPVAVPPPQ